MEPEGEKPGETLIGDFDAADELLFAAESGGLRSLGFDCAQWLGQIRHPWSNSYARDSDTPKPLCPLCSKRRSSRQLRPRLTVTR